MGRQSPAAAAAPSRVCLFPAELAPAPPLSLLPLRLSAPLQVEARLRQLEGKQLGSESAKPRGLPGAEKYDAARETGGGGGATLGQAKAYNADADVAMEDGEKKKKKKKVGGWTAGRGRRRAGLALGALSTHRRVFHYCFAAGAGLCGPTPGARFFSFFA